MDKNEALRKHLADLLGGGGAHLQLQDEVRSFPFKKGGARVPGAPHTAWQLIEHIRLAQWDILEFSRDPKHVSPDFPDGYWPDADTPPDQARWEASVRQVLDDLEQMVALVEDPATDLFAKIPHGTGQTILREALVLADHNSYHLGQLVFLRRQLS